MQDDYHRTSPGPVLDDFKNEYDCFLGRSYTEVFGIPPIIKIKRLIKVFLNISIYYLI